MVNTVRSWDKTVQLQQVLNKDAVKLRIVKAILAASSQNMSTWTMKTVETVELFWNISTQLSMERRRKILDCN